MRQAGSEEIRNASGKDTIVEDEMDRQMQGSRGEQTLVSNQRLLLVIVVSRKMRDGLLWLRATCAGAGDDVHSSHCS